MDEDQRTDWQDIDESELVYGNREERLLEQLGDIYWRKEYEGNGEIFAGVARTILSQNQNDAVSGPAAERLTDRFGTGEEMLTGLLRTTTGEVAELIYPCGPHNQKAEWIVGWAEFVADRFGDIETLNWFVENRDPDTIRERLTQATGVGRKTVDVVLTFNAGKDGVFAVDTHVYRVAKRLAMVPEYSGRDETAQILSEKIPPEKTGWGHSTMIAHGREVCHAENPECDGCPLEEECPKIGL